MITMRLVRRVTLTCTAITMCAFLLLAPRVQAAAQDSIQSSQGTVTINGKKLTFDYVTVDLTDPRVRVSPVIAEGGIGRTEKFASMVKRTEAVAAINGTFFDAYNKDETKQYPYGLILDNGWIKRTGQNQSLIVKTDRKVAIEQASLGMKFVVSQQGKKTYEFSPWAVNVYYDGTDGQIICFTPEYGSKVSYPNGTYIIVEHGKIKAITTNEADIPSQGFVIYVQGKNEYVLPSLHVGDEVELDQSLQFHQGEEKISAQDWIAAMGVGPKLITDGKLDINYERDGFNEAKITTTAAGRSFVGIDQQGQLVMGVFPAITMHNMAQGLLEFGLVEAMNMDGGASSGLYYNGVMKRAAGRNLSNALIVQYVDEAQVQLTVNGQFVHEFRGFTTDDWTMVPFRGLFERVQASFKWDAANQQITASKGSMSLLLTIGSRTAYMNGQPVEMPVAPELRGGYTYIPLRFVTEKLGAKLDWNAELYQANITIN